MVMFPSSVIHKPASAGGSPASHTPLGSIVSSCICDLDATSTDSYSGTGQTWANIEPTPADGAAQTDYDLYLGGTSGSSTDDPTFTGTPGYQDAYFVLDGGDYFTLKGAITTFLEGLCLSASGHDFTVVFVGYIDDNTATTGYFQTGGTGSTAPGVRINVGSTEGISLRIRGDSVVVTKNLGTLPLDTPFVSSVGYQDSDTKTYYAINSSTQSSQILTKDTCVNPSLNLVKFAAANGSSPLSTGARVYAFSLFNAQLTNTELASVIAEYNSRHGRTYA